MGTHCSRGQVANAGGLGGADTAGLASIRQLASTVVLTVALWGARLVGVVWWCRGTRSVGWDRSRAGFGCGVRRGVSGARVPNARSGRTQCTPGTCSTKCQGSLEVAVEAGKKQG